MDRPELVIATRNPDKLEELGRILRDLPVRLVSAGSLRAPEVVEDSETLAGNADKKALIVAAATGRLAIADDTGLEVDALGGRPGVRSARYAGEGATYADNNRRLLGELDGVEAGRRTARFRCVVSIAGPAAGLAGAAELLGRVEGVLEGAIATEPRGEHGFGYDPLFLVGGTGRTLAEHAPGEKNRISHRARALAKLCERLGELLAVRGV